MKSSFEREKKIKDSFGSKKTTHYDRDGRKTGETSERIDQFGLRIIEYYDRDGRKVGESRQRSSGFGFNRIEHFDRDGHKTGESRIKAKNKENPENLKKGNG